MRAGQLTKDIPETAADQRVECQSPHFTGAQVCVNKFPFSIDSAETVADRLKILSHITAKTLSDSGIIVSSKRWSCSFASRSAKIVPHWESACGESSEGLRDQGKRDAIFTPFASNSRDRPCGRSKTDPLIGRDITLLLPDRGR